MKNFTKTGSGPALKGPARRFLVSGGMAESSGYPRGGNRLVTGNRGGGSTTGLYRSVSRVTRLLLGVCLPLALGCANLIDPARPENLRATALSSHEIELTWTCEDEESGWWFFGDEDETPVSYIVYRDGREVADVSDPGHTDSGLEPDTLYCYRVSSYWDDLLTSWIYQVESSRSEEDCARTYPAVSLSGTVTLDGTGLEGVLVEISASYSGQASASSITGPAGRYFFPDLGHYTYQVTPSLEGYSFTPSQRSVTVRNNDVTGQDFTAYRIP